MDDHLNRPLLVFVEVILTLVLFDLTIRYSTYKSDGLWVNSKKPPLPKEEYECVKVGGVWKKMGIDPFESCNIKAMDRGALCTDSSECEGVCEADMTREELRQGMSGQTKKGRGTCSVWRVRLGCFGMVEKGIIKTICID